MAGETPANPAAPADERLASGLVARDEQVDQDDREGPVFEDHVAREAVFDRVPYEAAVDVPREKQHDREGALVDDQVDGQRGDRPGQERDDLADEQRKDERSSRSDGRSVDPEAAI